MMRTMSGLILAALAATASAKTDEPVKLDPREARDLAKALDGKVAGKPVSCVSTFRGENLRAVGDHTLVYRVSKKLVYRNDLQGVCHGLSFGDALVLRVWGNEYCRGDIAHSVNLTSGSLSGTCALGDFVPYTSGAAG
ncbi:MAG TPA: DUF6491 family protein [Sphingobium sp.]